jgi:hypothetical protein
MSMSPLSALTTEQILRRLDVRDHLLSAASEERFEQLSVIFAHAEYLGHLLHAARECLEATISDCGPEVNPALPDNTTLLLWERGLALPKEVDDGHVTALVRWYVDQLRYQRQETTEGRLARDSVGLYCELQRDEPSYSLRDVPR